MRLETVGEIVRTLRARKDLDQIDLAKACGWRDASAVSRIETDRITPTRRTLTKLSDALSGPQTLPPEQIYATLLAAIGTLPSRDDVEQMRANKPAIERWRGPTYILDQAWNAWATNAACLERLGFPQNAVGRNVLELYLEDGSCRRAVGQAWPAVMDGLLARFRRETVRHEERRWYRALMSKLQTYPGFAASWERSAVNGAHDLALRVPFEPDPRFTIVSVVADPDD